MKIKNCRDLFYAEENKKPDVSGIPVLEMYVKEPFGLNAPLPQNYHREDRRYRSRTRPRDFLDAFTDRIKRVRCEAKERSWLHWGRVRFNCQALDFTQKAEVVDSLHSYELTIDFVEESCSKAALNGGDTDWVGVEGYELQRLTGNIRVPGSRRDFGTDDVGYTAINEVSGNIADHCNRRRMNEYMAITFLGIAQKYFKAEGSESEEMGRFKAYQEKACLAYADLLNENLKPRCYDDQWGERYLAASHPDPENQVRGRLVDHDFVYHRPIEQNRYVGAPSDRSIGTGNSRRYGNIDCHLDAWDQLF